MMSKTKYSISKRKSLPAPTFQGCPWLTWDVQSVQDSKKPWHSLTLGLAPQFRKQWLKNLRGENHHPGKGGIDYKEYNYSA